MEKKQVIIKFRLDRMDIKILQKIGYLDGRGRPIKTRNLSGLFRQLLKSKFGTDDAFIKARRYEIGQLNSQIIRARKKIKNYVQEIKQLEGVEPNGIKRIPEISEYRTEPEEETTVK